MKTALSISVALAIGISVASAKTDLPKCKAQKYNGTPAVRALGDTLVSAYNEVMLVNESLGGEAAYCLSRSGMEESGLSFGVSQLDFRTNDANAWPTFEKIVAVATEEVPDIKFSKDELEFLKSKLVTKKAPRAKDLLAKTDKRLEDLLFRANRALKTNGSQKIINEYHLRHVQLKAAFLRETSATIRGSRVKADELTRDSLAFQLLLMDFKNLFGSISGEVLPFMQNGVLEKNGKSLKIAGSKFAVSDMIKYSLTTKQGSSCTRSGRAEILRRTGYVLVIARKYGDKTTWTQADIEFFKNELPKVISERCTSRAVDLKHLRAFAASF
jgi:hypothetical protein